jgi:hypothetical protein
MTAEGRAPTAAPSPREQAARRLAADLVRLGAGESVRALEALAVVLARGGIAWTGETEPSGLAEPGASFADEAAADARLEALGRRIARRALAGCLADPTRRADAVHRLGEHPSWTHGLAPVAEIGPFLFYRLTPESAPWPPAEDCDPAATGLSGRSGDGWPSGRRQRS